ncbi:sulfatase-like hydrolase/transferase, partial [Verrucomicrobia bacterium]|nr:sulfatase-like hydrolase/transferase [Verrucomicrobiota bacterium]
RGGAKMHGDEETLAEALGSHGYKTGIFGKWHLGDTYPMRPSDQGFAESLIHKSGGIGQSPDHPNRYFNPKLWRNGEPVTSSGYCTDLFFDDALSFIERNQRHPFFVYLALNAPHTPLEIAERYVAPYRAKGLDESTSKVYGMVQNIDENFGRLLRRLDTLGIREETVVFFLGDNGPQQRRFNGGLRGRKSSVFEGGIRSLGLMQWPGHTRAGTALVERVAHIDLFPTVLDIVGVPTKERKLDGISLLPLLSGQARGHAERFLFFQCHRGLTPTKYQNAAILGERWKLVMNEGQFSNEDFQAGGTFGDIMLYDLEQDPGELINRSGVNSHVVSDLLKRYDQWFDDVKMSRNFTPGKLVVGSKEENPVRLCRYQDGHFVGGYSQGWDIEVLRTGRYKIEVKVPKAIGLNRLFLSWQDQVLSRSVDDSNPTAQFLLREGMGRLEIWAQEDGNIRIRHGDNSVTGDAILTLLED